ncbi:MAG: DUF4097 domain-containing protein [Lachnospiraceae bacterium]|jgi:DUF4097 and DUF4098 domain-containing protein YvlB|nr:DUF4097 domain-containing protein [Lachnospiraceae bacterium]
MKKSTKSTVWVGCVSIGIGLLFSIAAVTLGAVTAVPELMRTGDIKGISFFNTPWGRMEDLADEGWESFKGQLFQESGKKTAVAKADDIGKLDIDCGAAELLIKESEDDSVYLATNSYVKVKYRVEDDDLYIKCKGKTGTDIHGKVELYLPKEVTAERIKIDLGAGTVKNETALHAEELFLEIGAGDASLSDVTVQTTEAHVGAGKLRFDKFVTEELKTDVAMGEFSFDGRIDQEAAVDVAMGNAEIQLSDSSDEYSCEVSVGAGEVTVGGQKMAGAYDGEFGDGDKELNLDCSMGRIKVTFAK